MSMDDDQVTIPSTAQQHMQKAEEYRWKAERCITEQKFDRVAAYAAMAQLHMLCVIKFDR